MNGTKRLSMTLVRHGESIWNQANLFTGWENVDLTAKGVNEALEAGRMLAIAQQNYTRGYTSSLKRAQRTYGYILEGLLANNSMFSLFQLI